ncbi:hypothetical protein FBU31_005173, partial [Coemansia sp. 'formosensis']
VSNLGDLISLVDDDYPVYSVYSDEGDGKEETPVDDTLYEYYITDQFYSRFNSLPEYDEPQFPVLTRLDLRGPLTSRYPRVFAGSPITSLVLSDQDFSWSVDWNLSAFHFLRNLSIRIWHNMNKDITTCISKPLSTLFLTVHSNLQHLLLAMNLQVDTRLRFEAPSFANNLSSLTLEGGYGQHDVEHLLQLFPNLRTLNVCTIVCGPIFTVPTLIDKYRQMCIKQTLTSINSSLCILEAYGQRYFSSYYSIDFIPWSRRLMAPVLNHYRGMLVGLVCRLPSLDAFRVALSLLTASMNAFAQLLALMSV